MYDCDFYYFFFTSPGVCQKIRCLLLKVGSCFMGLFIWPVSLQADRIAYLSNVTHVPK